MLEGARIIDKLDRYVLEAAARFLAERRRQGLPVVPVSVNLSRVDFEVSQPLDMVEEVMKRYRLPRESLLALNEQLTADEEETLPEGTCVIAYKR